MIQTRQVLPGSFRTSRTSHGLGSAVPSERVDPYFDPMVAEDWGAFRRAVRSDSKGVKRRHSDSKLPQTLFDRDIREERLRYIQDASTEILVSSFSFTDHAIIHALKDSEEKGVKVRIISNPAQYKGGTWGRLHVVMLKNCHEKFMVIDNTVVFNGSANYSEHSHRDMYENATLLFDEESIGAFRTRFDFLWKSVY